MLCDMRCGSGEGSERPQGEGGQWWVALGDVFELVSRMNACSGQGKWEPRESEKEMVKGVIGG